MIALARSATREFLARLAGSLMLLSTISETERTLTGTCYFAAFALVAYAATLCARPFFREAWQP